jgi:hypothetical protein
METVNVWWELLKSWFSHLRLICLVLNFCGWSTCDEDYAIPWLIAVLSTAGYSLSEPAVRLLYCKTKALIGLGNTFQDTVNKTAEESLNGSKFPHVCVVAPVLCPFCKGELEQDSKHHRRFKEPNHADRILGYRS